MLGPGEQRLFELLSVFTGIHVDAVEQVASDAGLSAMPGSIPLEALTSLLDKSLIRPSEARGDRPAGS